MNSFIITKNARSEVIDAHDFYDSIQDHRMDRVLAIVPLHGDDILVVWAGDNEKDDDMTMPAEGWANENHK